MKRTSWLVLGLLLLPLAVAQPGDDPSGRPDQTGSPPDDTPVPDERPGPPVEVEDARGGFGSRPQDGSPRPAFSYNLSRGAMVLERADQQVLEAVFDAVIEFRDRDGDGAYDVGEEVVQRFGVRELEETLEHQGATRRDAVYALSEGGELRLRFQLAPPGAADAAKFDVVITDFPYQANDTRLALGIGVGAAGLRDGEVDGMPAVVGQGTGDVPYLSWVPEATVGGSVSPVAASVHMAADGQSSIVYWAYGQGDIDHDPLLGLTSVSLDRLGDPVVFVVSLLAGGILLAAGYELRRRYRP